MIWSRKWAAGALAAALVIVTPALALNVQPVIIDLLSAGRQSSAVVTLENTFPDPVPVEVVVHPVRVVDGRLVEMEDEIVDDLLVFPAQSTVAGGAAQAFRVQWIGDPAPAQSQHFYATVAQLPVALAPNQNAIQVLHRFRVLVNVGQPGGKSELKVIDTRIETDAQGAHHPVISVANSGNSYGYVGRQRMTIIQTIGENSEVYRKTFQPEDIQQEMGLGLVPSGQTRVLPIGVDLPRPDGRITILLTAVSS